jgi:hypothetical protein
MRTIPLYLALITALTSIAPAQACFQIHGRAVEYRGDAFFEIWHVGTHHIFFPSDAKSVDLICRYFDCDSGDRQPALFADFTVCPTEHFVTGAAQAAKVTAVEHPFVIPDWPPQTSPREFLKDFLSWYVPRTRSGSTPSGWKGTLELMHWDFNPKLANLLEADSAIEPSCQGNLPQDFDPLLNTTQPAEHYEVGAIDAHNGSFKAKIYHVTDSKRSANPDVIAEFVKQNQRWYFLNFAYPSNRTDLVSILKAPRPACSATPETAAK